MRVLLSQIDFVSAGEVVYPPGGTLGPRLQRDVQLVLVHSGSAAIAVDGAPRAAVPAGCVALLLPGHRERFEFDRRRATHHAWVQARMTDPPLERLAGLPPVQPVSAALGELVRAAVAASAAPLSTAPELLAALAAAALWRYAGEAEAGPPGASRAVERARAFIHAHQGEPLDLGRIAAAAHVSPAHLVRRFRAELGTTPMAYLWQRRVATGVELLTNTGLSVNEIAERAGFRTVYHFSRRVRQATGDSPTGIRRRRWST
jgi:AraC family transcriptional regulator of arabinose operon